jgi:hypothetical protein
MSFVARVGGFLGRPRLGVGTGFAVGTVAAGLLLTAAVGPPAALASANLNWGTGTKVPLPSGGSKSGDVEMHSVSCPSAGNCTAVGRYEDASANRLGLLLTQKLGTWTAVEATLPTGADSDPNPILGPVSCASAGNCTTVGFYNDTSGKQQGVMLTETAGRWAPGVMAVPPSAATNPMVTINAVSCTSPGNCTAAGWYTDSSGHQQGLVLTQSSGRWVAAKAKLPAGAATNPLVYTSSVSCASAGNCAVVGEYNDTSGNEQGLLLTESSGTWVAAKAKLPSGAAANPFAAFTSLSCASAGNCTAVGYYEDTSGHSQGLMITQSSRAWGNGVKATLPAGAAKNPDAGIESVSCPSAGNCTAVGGYEDASGHGQAVLLIETSGKWIASVKALLPTGAAANPSAGMDSVSCPSVGNCAAIGTYSDRSGTEGLLLTQSGGTWARGVKAALPGGAAADPDVTMGAVSCPSVGSCTAVGRYDTSVFVGLVFGASPTSPRLSAKATSSGTVGKPIAASAVTATLSLGAGPVGTIRFRVFGPQRSAPRSCLAGGRIVGGAVTVSGNRAYHPTAGFTPTAAGTYWWYASYSGDPSDKAAASACGPSMAKTVVAPVPVVSSFTQTHLSWRGGTALPTIASAPKAPVGTTFTFVVSQSATAKLVFTRGNQVKGTLSMAASAGKHAIKFQGRLSSTHRLAPGHYTVAITATNANHATSLPKKLSFTIVS